MRRAGAAVAAAVALTLALAGAPVPRPSILLVTIDTLRRDALGFLGHRNETPAIDRLAAASFRFPAAVAPAPLTGPSHASILTGLLPRSHGVHDNGQVLGSGPATLPALLAGRGWNTAAFVSGFTLRAHVCGLDRGFARYDDELPPDGAGTPERPAAATTRAALAWLARARGPWFAWVHYFDPHAPYAPPRAFWRPGPRGTYDGEVSYVDDQLGTLLENLPKAGGPAIVVLTADHGESFGEHGQTGHGGSVYDTTLLVPLLWRAPGIAPGESARPARLVDVMPTLLELAGVPAPRGDGTSLVSLLRGRDREIPPAVIETYEPWLTFGWAPLTGIRTARWKLVAAPRPELYDLVSDPDELHDVAAEPANRNEVARLARALASGAPGSAAASRGSAGTAEALRSLGYLGGSSGSAPPRGLPDPKDRLLERRELLAAEDLARSGRLADAAAAFEALLAREPSSLFACSRLGIVYLRLDAPQRAMPPLEKAVRMDPGRADDRFNLATAYLRSGRSADAASELRAVLRLQPQNADARRLLAAIR